MKDKIHPEILLFLSEFLAIPEMIDKSKEGAMQLLISLRNNEHNKGRLEFMKSGMEWIDHWKVNGQINSMMVIKLRMLVLNPEMTYLIKEDGKEPKSYEVL